MNKPKIGTQIKYTPKGAGVYYQLHGCWPPKMNGAQDGVFGELVSIGAMNICTVKKPSGNTENFIWRFSDGLNDHFDWEGKQDLRR